MPKVASQRVFELRTRVQLQNARKSELRDFSEAVKQGIRESSGDFPSVKAFLVKPLPRGSDITVGLRIEDPVTPNIETTANRLLVTVLSNLADEENSARAVIKESELKRT